MATVTNLRPGSKGDDVKKLQQALIKEGYDVGGTKDDGVFGNKTLAAVKKYQKDNGLTVDGVAGKNTLGSLYAAKPPAPAAPKANAGKGNEKPKATGTPKDDAPIEEAPPVTSPSGFTYGDFSYGSFTPSDIVNQANALIQQQQANKPGAYAPVWQDEADAYLSKYQNRDPFSYDFNSDALYQQYKDNYIQQGQMAMMDAMGQAAAMTGGYGNSYAQSVGQQAYNQQLSQLNEIMPELYGMAYDRYNQEGQDMLSMYDLYMNRENQEYGRYQDSLDNWYQEMNRLTSDYDTLYDREHSDWETGYNTAWQEYLTDRNEDFTTKANNKSDLINLIASTGYKPTDDELASIGMTRAQANSYAKAYTDSKKSTGTSVKTEKPVTYKDLDLDKARKDFNSATTIEDVDYWATIYKNEGYNPETIKTMAQAARDRIAKGGDDNKTGLGAIWEGITGLFK
jgi:peptidoglycan hydrolase-like protein with peptidoglycan-binding domain